MALNQKTISSNQIKGYVSPNNIIDYKIRGTVLENNSHLILEAISSGQIKANDLFHVDRYSICSSIEAAFSDCDFKFLTRHQDLLKPIIHTPLAETLLFKCGYGSFIKEPSAKGKLLIDLGVNKDVYFDLSHAAHQDYLGKTPLMACKSMPLIDYMLENGANVELLEKPNAWLENFRPYIKDHQTFINFLKEAIDTGVIQKETLNRKIFQLVQVRNDIETVIYKKEFFLVIKDKLNTPEPLTKTAYDIAKEDGPTAKIWSLQKYLQGKTLDDDFQSKYNLIAKKEKELDLDGAIKLARQAVKDNNPIFLNNLENHINLLKALKPGKKNLLLIAMQENNPEYAEKIMKLNVLDKEKTGVSQSSYLEFAIIKGVGKMGEMAVDYGYYRKSDQNEPRGMSITNDLLKKGMTKLAFKLYLLGFPFNNNSMHFKKMTKMELKKIKNEVLDNNLDEPKKAVKPKML